MSEVEQFYDDFSEYYHLIFESWDEERSYQGKHLSEAIETELRFSSPRILDVTCGIGTQVLALRELGYDIQGMDISPQSVERAKREAKQRNLSTSFSVGDVRELSSLVSDQFDLTISCDNSLSHLLSDDEILIALKQMRAVTRPGGACLVTIRNYDEEPRDKRVLNPYGIREFNGQTIVLFQVWEYHGDIYDLFWYVIVHDPTGKEPQTRVFPSKLYAIPLNQFVSLMEKAGFINVRRVQDSFFQPVLVGENPK